MARFRVPRSAEWAVFEYLGRIDAGEVVVAELRGTFSWRDITGSATDHETGRAVKSAPARQATRRRRPGSQRAWRQAMMAGVSIYMRVVMQDCPQPSMSDLAALLREQTASAS